VQGVAKKLRRFVYTPTAVFFNLFAAAEPHISVKVTHGTPCIDQWVQRRELLYRLIPLAGQSRAPVGKGKTKQTKMTNYNMKFDRINRQQYVIVFNQTRRARRSSTAAYIVPPPTQKTYHVDALGQISVFW